MKRSAALKTYNVYSDGVWTAVNAKDPVRALDLLGIKSIVGIRIHQVNGATIQHIYEGHQFYEEV